MKLSRQHQVYVGILALGGVALLADRTIFAPDEAAAISVSEFLVSGADEAGEQIIATAPSATQAQQSIAARLRTTATASQISPQATQDAFWPAWRPREQDAARPGQTADQILMQKFTNNFRLTAVMDREQGGYAILNGNKSLRVGNALDGVTLTSVASRSATFQAGTTSITLEVQLETKQEAGKAESKAPRPEPGPGESSDSR